VAGQDAQVAGSSLDPVAAFSPVNWAVEEGREALLVAPDWSIVLPRLGGLGLVAIACVALSTRAFRAYQRPA